MKSFTQFLEDMKLPSNYTDYKAPAVQAAHSRSMTSASKMRQIGMNATANDPKNDAMDNISGQSGVAQPLSGTKIRSGVGKGLKVGDPGVKVEQSKWWEKPTSIEQRPDGSSTSTFTDDKGKKVKVDRTGKELTIEKPKDGLF